MKLLTFFLAGAALAAPAKRPKKNPEPIWTLSFPGERPSAAYFDAASGSLYVSLRDPNGEGGRIAQVSLEGKLEKASVARSKGPPGALRSYDGRLYWISGQSVQSYGPVEGSLNEGALAPELGAPTDIAIAKGPVIYVGTAAGTLVHLVTGLAPSQDLHGAPITGLFLLQSSLHILRGRRLEVFGVSASEDPQESALDLCSESCRGLERTSAGDWLTVRGVSVVAVNGKADAKTLYAAPAGSELGRPAYVYRMNTKEDFFVLPFPALGEIRAYRVNEGAK